ncbi:unnamed protein product, partial [Pylaiella littoralis]
NTGQIHSASTWLSTSHSVVTFPVPATSSTARKHEAPSTTCTDCVTHFPERSPLHFTLQCPSLLGVVPDSQQEVGGCDGERRRRKCSQPRPSGAKEV